MLKAFLLFHFIISFIFLDFFLNIAYFCAKKKKEKI